ncbi:hypothetical protein IscW_ISCW022902, partial [Ixodes scapularis]
NREAEEMSKNGLTVAKSALFPIYSTGGLLFICVFLLDCLDATAMFLADTPFFKLDYFSTCPSFSRQHGSLLVGSFLGGGVGGGRRRRTPLPCQPYSGESEL